MTDETSPPPPPTGTPEAMAIMMEMMAARENPQVHVRVEFLRVRPFPGERKVVEVTVPHLSRADSVAREQENLPHDEWCILSMVEVKQ